MVNSRSPWACEVVIFLSTVIRGKLMHGLAYGLRFRRVHAVELVYVLETGVRYHLLALSLFTNFARGYPTPFGAPCVHSVAILFCDGVRV